jgi:hypothetical protein
MRKKSNRLLEVARLAMKLGREHMSDYGAVTSRKDFTQRQLMACLVLRAYLKTTYRGVIEILETSEQLRTELGMKEKLPHYSTLAKFCERSAVLEILTAMLRRLGGAALRQESQPVAIDATGLETSTASAHFVSRSKKERKKWVKLSVAILTTSLLPLGAVLDWGPNNDKCQVWPLLQQSLSGQPIKPPKLYADAGYDAEWVHGVCREEFGIATTVIKPARCAADGSRRGEYRSQMSEDYLKAQGYGLRWKVESYISGLKRTTGSTLLARKPANLLKEAAFKVLAYALNR